MITTVAAPPIIYRLLSLILLAAGFTAILIDNPYSVKVWQLYLLLGGMLILAAEILRWLSERQRRTEAALRQSQQQLDEFLSQSLNDFSITAPKEPMGWDEIVEQLTLFHTVAESAAEAIAISAPGGRLVYVNPAHEQLFGYPAEETRQKNYQDFFPDDTLAFIKREIKPILLRGERWEGDLVAQRADGSHIILWSSMGTLLDEEGEILYGFSFMQDVTARREAEAAERTRRAVAELLKETAVLLTSSLQLDEVIRAILTNVARVIPHRSVALFLLEDEKQLYQLYNTGAGDGHVIQARSLDIPLKAVPILQEMAQSGDPRIIGDVKEYPEWVDHPEALWVRSFVGAPIQAEERTLGFLVLLGDEPDYFHHSHVQNLATFATQAAIAIQNAQHYAEETELRQALETVQQAGLNLIASLKLSQVLDQILQAAFKLVDAKNGYIFLAENGRLTFMAGLTQSGPVSHPFSVPRPRGVTYTTLRRQETVIVSDSREHPLFATAPPEWDRIAIISLPLKFHDHTLGVMNVSFDEPYSFTQIQQRVLNLLAVYAAVAIQNARLHEQIRQYANDLKKRVANRTSELVKERNRLQVILDNVGDGIFFADETTEIHFVNPALERITGYSANELIGRTPRMWRGTTPRPVIDEMDQTLQAGSAWSGELINRRKDSALYDAYVIITPLLDEEGELYGYVGSQRDVTHLKELNQLKEQFVSRIGHELITPVATIMLYLDLIQRDPERNIDHYLDTLQREGKRLDKLVRGFLRLADLSTDSAPVHLSQHDVGAILRHAAPEWRGWAEEHALSFHLHLPPAPLPASTDPELLREATEILLDNSLKYTRPGGRIILTASRRYQERPWIAITVSDTGPGIALDEIPHLFDRFYRGDATRDYNVPGAGLGLAICREIIDRLQGQITVESKPDQETSFTLWVPAPPRNEDPEI